MTFDTNDLVLSLPLLFLTVAGIVLLMLDAFSRVVLVGRDHHLKLPAETSEAVAVPPPGSRNYLMPVTVLFLLATLAIIVWQAGTLPETPVLIYRGMLQIDRFGLFADPVDNLFRVTSFKLEAESLGIRRIDLGSRGGRIEFHPKPNIEPIRIIELIQRDRAYRLDGGEKLRITKELPDAESRFAELKSVFERLARKQAA